MDKKPFFTFDLQNCDDRQIGELARFQKENFDIEAILEAASNLKYVKAAANVITEQLSNPEDEFVRLIGRKIYEGSVTKTVMESLRPAIQAALDEVVRNRIQEKLNVTFGKETGPADASEKRAIEDTPKPEGEIVTTEDEIQAFMIVRAIGSRIASIDKITMRDARSYCSIFYDDNNRKPICRLYFNSKTTKSIGIFDSTKNEQKFQIEKLSDIYQYSDQITAVIETYL